MAYSKETKPKNTEMEFRMGRRLERLKYAAVIVIIAVSFVFYFIYDHILTPIIPELMGFPLFMFFLLMDSLLVLLCFRIIEKIQKRIYYHVTPTGLEYVFFKRTLTYPWNSFTEARYGRVGIGVVCPVSFTVNGHELRLNQYTERIWGLAHTMLKHISPYVQVSAELIEQVAVMESVQ